MKCFVIAESDKVRALNTAGIQGLAYENLPDVRKAVEEAVGDRNIGTLLISRKVQEEAHDILERHGKRAVLPVVMLLEQ